MKSETAIAIASVCPVSAAAIPPPPSSSSFPEVRNAMPRTRKKAMKHMADAVNAPARSSESTNLATTLRLPLICLVARPLKQTRASERRTSVHTEKYVDATIEKRACRVLGGGVCVCVCVWGGALMKIKRWGVVSRFYSF